MTEPLELVVPAAAAGERLDHFLGAVEAVGSRAAAQRLIERGAVTVDGAARQKRHRLSAGETIREHESPFDAAGSGLHVSRLLDLMHDKPRWTKCPRASLRAMEEQIKRGCSCWDSMDLA